MVFPVITPQSIRMGIVGSGTMGSGIALAALLASIPVSLYDVDVVMLEKAQNYIQHHLQRKNKGEKLDSLLLVTRLEELKSCNLIIEAIPEDINLKLDLFQRMDKISPLPAILASNTSTMSITQIASTITTPQRVIGMHFFNPAAVMPLVEIISAAQTDPKVTQTVQSIAEKMGKFPVIVKDQPGFIVNRVARPFYGEALRLLGEGVASHQDIDWIFCHGGHFRMGPFELMDLIGIDVNYQAMLSMYEQTWGEPRYRPHWIQRQKVMQNTLGRKSGQGFYNYSGKNGALIQPELPRQKKTPANILISPGSWAPGIKSTLEDAGFRLESQLVDENNDDYFLAIIPASRRENLKDLAVYWDSILPTRIPILVQACETTISETVSWLKHPERVAGFDGLFFSSGHAVTLVAHSALEESTQNRITNFISNLGKLPIWITDTPGLILPRIVSMLVNEAAFALLAGIADDSAIDMAMQLGANYPLGPLTWGKSLGYPTVLQILDHLYDEYHEERYRAAPNIRQWDRTKP